MRCLLTIVCVALAPAPVAAQRVDSAELGDRTVAIPITAARILASVDGAAATERPVHARKDQVVMLYAAVEAGGHWFTDAPGWPHARPLARAPYATVRWAKLEPAAADYSNEDASGFHFTQIDYQPTALDARTTTIAADVRPTLTPDHGDGVGTMRYQLVVTQGDARSRARAPRPARPRLGRPHRRRDARHRSAATTRTSAFSPRCSASRTSGPPPGIDRQDAPERAPRGLRLRGLRGLRRAPHGQARLVHVDRRAAAA